MKKTLLDMIAEGLMRSCLKETKQKAKDFLGLFDMGNEDDIHLSIEEMLNKITTGMKRASAREAVQRAVEYSDKHELSPEDENYIISLLEKYLE